MSTGLDVFDTTLQQTNLWLKDLTEHLGLDRKHAYKVLSATLHAVRDRIGPENAAHLGAQLPILMRGFYCEGWRAAGTPTKLRHKQEFLDYVSGDVFRGLGIDPEKAVRAVWAGPPRHFHRYRARTRESGGSGNRRRQADTAIWRAG